jgi:general secretion pathway protein D
MRAKNFLAWLAVPAMSLIASACSGGASLQDAWAEKVSASQSQAPSARSHRQTQKSFDVFGGGRSPSKDNDGGLQGEEVKGSGKFVANRAAFQAERTASGADGITLNLVGASIPDAAKVVLGDILKLNYLIDDKAVGAITLQTSKPIVRDAVLTVFETALKSSNLALIKTSDGAYRIVPLPAAERTGRGVAFGSDRVQGGQQVRVIPLQYVSSNEMSRVIEPVVPQRTVVRADATRNLLMVSGSSEDITMVTELVALFDVDWMAGMSFGVYPTKSTNPDELVKELEAVFGTQKDGPLGGTIKFLPNRRLGSVLVITSRPAYLQKVSDWIQKLDKVATKSEERIFVYKIQNRSADQLASLLKQFLSPNGAAQDAALPLSPKFETASSTTQPVASSSSQPTQPGGQSIFGASPGNAPLSTRRVEEPEPARIEASTGEPSLGPQKKNQFGTRIVADVAKNTLVIQATPKEYERILQLLQFLDVVSTQVLLEAVIAEVSLNDELRFGMRWFFEKKKNQFTFSDAASGAVASVFPGFSYFFSSKSVDVAINALAEVTDVKVISAPSLMVVDNKTAKLQVGDQVPIVTQTAQPVAGAGAPIVNSVQLKDTGVILSVTPRVNDSGRIELEIEQEVSNVTRTTSSGIDSPTIQQRRIKTTVEVTDGQVLALGGLIQQRENVSKTQIPLLGDIPIIGNAFREKNDRIDKTELLIFIRPRVVRDSQEGTAVTEEYRRQLNLRSPRILSTTDKRERDIKRLAH